MDASQPISITPSLIVPAATSPIVIVGANGTGKSMLGVEIERRGAERIGARRALDIPNDIPPLSISAAEQQRTLLYTQTRYQRSLMHYDLPAILTELQAQELELGSALREKNLAQPGYHATLEELVSNLDHVKHIWHELFPGRELSFRYGQPRVTPRHRGVTTTVQQSEMSDGERQALYLALKVAGMKDNRVVVVDEPETHLHPALARRLWDMLQDLRPTSRFIYITHDIHFALSRRGAVYVACRANGEHQLVSNVPDAVLGDILGAATMPVGVSRVVFCEGTSRSLDAGLFDAWFTNSDTSVYPVESCDDVVASVDGFSLLPHVTARAIGIIDRDARCDEEIDHLRERGIHVLPVAEIEHLYALPQVLQAVLRHVGVVTDHEIAARMSTLHARLRNHFQAGAHKLALERAQDRVRWHLQFPLTTLSAGASPMDAEASLVAGYRAATIRIAPEAMYADATAVVTGALNGTTEDILKLLPGKGSLGIASQILQMQNDAYTRLVREGLRGSITDGLKNALRAALAPHLPG